MVPLPTVPPGKALAAPLRRGFFCATGLRSPPGPAALLDADTPANSVVAGRGDTPQRDIGVVIGVVEEFYPFRARLHGQSIRERVSDSTLQSVVEYFPTEPGSVFPARADAVGGGGDRGQCCHHPRVMPRGQQLAADTGGNGFSHPPRRRRRSVCRERRPRWQPCKTLYAAGYRHQGE
jgi:hypothetical protein